MLRIDAHTHAYPEKDRETVLERVRLLDGHLASDNPWRRPEESWDRFLRLELSSSDREKIAGHNLRRLLGPGPLE